MQAIFQSQSLYKNWPKSKKKKSKNQKQNKSRDLHKDYNYVILMMAYAIHSNVRNLGLFFNYDKVGILK
jgi:hypothetical protein